MFAYCGNNPVIRLDTRGYLWDELMDNLINDINKAKKALNNSVKGTHNRY
jgi:hypothetical protein